MCDKLPQIISIDNTFLLVYAADMKKTAKKKRARRATSGVAPIRFDTSDRKRLGWLQDDLGGLTLAGAVKWAVKDAYDRRKALQKVGRMSQELRGTMPFEGHGRGSVSQFMGCKCVECGPADALQSDIRQRVASAVTPEDEPGIREAYNKNMEPYRAESKGSDK